MLQKTKSNVGAPQLGPKYGVLKHWPVYTARYTAANSGTYVFGEAGNGNYPGF